MSENAVKQPSDSDKWELRVLGDTDRNLRSIIEHKRPDSGSVETNFRPSANPAPSRRDEFQASIALVQEACDSIRIAEQRIHELENEVEQAAVQTKHDLQIMLERIKGLQDELKAANARSESAEARAMQAEEWLSRLHSAITQSFGTQTVEVHQRLREPA